MTARPSVAASVAAVAAAAGTMVLLGLELVPVAVIELGGLGLVAGGLSYRRDDHAVAGSVLALAGAGGCVAAVGLAAVRASGLTELLWVLPGTLGVAALGLAVAPLRGSGSRWLVKAGAGGIFLAVGMAGLFRTVPFGTLLLATAGTVLAWDAGEHAIEVGRQLGRSASTWRLDAAHVGATAAVGGLGVAVGHAVAGLQAGRLSLAAYAVLFAAMLGLTLALHR